MSYQYEDDFEADEASDVNMTTSEVTTKSNEQETSTEYELSSHKAKPHAGASSEEKKSITSSAEESSPLHVKSSNSNSNSGSSGSKKHVAKAHGSTSHKTNDLSDCVKASSTATSSSHHSASSHEHSSEYSQSSASTSRSSEASLASSVQLESESSTTPHKTTTKHVTKEVHENKSASTQKERSNDHHDHDDKSDSEYETESSTHENEKRVEDKNKPTAMRGESPRIQSRTSVPNNTTNNSNTIISPGKRTSVMDRNGQFLHHSNITSVEVRPTELSSFHGSEDSVSIEDEMCNSITDEKAHNKTNSNNNNNKVKGNATASTNTGKGEGKVESKEATTTTKALNGNTKNESQQKSSLPVKSSLQSSSSSSASYEYEYEEESESASSTPKKENTSTNKVEANHEAKETTSSILTRDATQPSTVQRVSAGVQLEESKQNNNSYNKEVKINAPASIGTRKNQINSKVSISEVERTKPIISKVHPNGPIPDNCTWVDERGWLEKKIEELKNSVMQYNSQIEAKERAINQAKQQAGKTSNNKNTKSEPSASVPQEAISPQMAQLQNDNVHLENEYRVYYGAVIDVEFLLEQARMQLNVVQDQLRLLKKQRIQLGIRDRRAAHVIEETHTKLPPIEERHWRQVNDGYYGHAQLHKKINQLQRDIEHGQESIYMIKHKCEELESVVHAEHFTQMPLKEFHALKEQHANNLKTIRHLRAAISIYQNAMNKERRGSSAAMGRRGSSFINYSGNSKANSRLNSAAGSHPHGGQHNNNSGLLSNNNNLNYHESNVKGKRQPSARSITSLGLNDELHDEVDSRLIGEQNELKTRQAELYEVMDDLNNKIEQRIAQYNANVEFVKQRTANNNSSTSNMFAATPIHRERKVHQPLSINEVTPERANTSSAAERRKSSARRNTSDNYDIDQLSNKNKKDSSNNKNSNNVNRARGRNTRKEDEINVANSAIRSRSDSAPIPVQGNSTSRPLHLPELAKAKNINININSNSNNNNNVTKSKNSEKNSGRAAETKADAKVKNTQTNYDNKKGKNTDNNNNKSGRNASLQEENSMSEILEAIDEKNKQIQRDVEREVKKSNDTHVEQTRNASNRNMKQKEAQQQQHQQQKQHKEEEIKEELSAEEEEEDEEEEYEYEYEEESEEDEGNDKSKKGVTGQVTSNNNTNKLKKEQQNELASTNSSEISNPFVKNSNNNNNNIKKTTNTYSAAPVEQPKLHKPLPVNDRKTNSSVDGVKRSGQINNSSNNMAKVQPSLSSMASSGRSTPEWLR